MQATTNDRERSQCATNSKEKKDANERERESEN